MAEAGTNEDLLLYEDILARLEGIIRRLESGDATLAESLALYQEAVSLSGKADRLLRHAEDVLTASREAEARDA